MIKVQVPATSANMGPGFDTLGVALSFYNTMEVEETDKDVVVEVSGEKPQMLVNPKHHLIVETIDKLFQLAGTERKGLHLTCDNAIPFARGLGSSSAAIVSGLYGANALLQNAFSEADLIKIATEIEGHPDNVVPAICGGFTVACQEDSSVRYVKCSVPKQIVAVVAIPDFKLSTAKARAVLPQDVPMKDAVFNMSRAAMLVAAALQQDFHLWGKMMEDKLHQPYRFPLIPGADEVIANAKEAGAISCVLSGAGPTMIAWGTEDKSCAVAEGMKQGFAAAEISCETMVLTVDNQGAVILP